MQSCHGKGPSDSEGAVVKLALTRAELRDIYFAMTKDAVDYLIENVSIDAVRA